MPHNFRFCPYCGGELKGDFKFCPYCGAPLEIENEHVKKEHPTETPREQTKIILQTVTMEEPNEKQVEEYKKEFSIHDIPQSETASKGRKCKIKVKGVKKEKFSNELIFDGSKGTKFGKLKLDEALKLFEKIPKTYPRPLSEKDNPIIFEINDGALRIGVLSNGKEAKYHITGILPTLGVLVGFTILDDATYDEAVEAIRRFYLEKDFVRRAYKAKEKYLERKEIAEGKYVVKIPGVFRREGFEDKVASVLYLTEKGLHLYAHDGVYYSMEMPEDLPYFTREGIQRIKFNKKYSEMEVEYIDPEGKKMAFKFYFILPEEGMRYYQILSSEFPGRVKVKGGWFG